MFVTHQTPRQTQSQELNCTSFGQLIPLSIRRTVLRIEARSMPTYEFFCNACEQPFSKTLTAEEFEEGGTVCPECGSEEVEQRLTAFYPINHKETA
jgi:putative FmdB family regulatory protein